MKRAAAIGVIVAAAVGAWLGLRDGEPPASTLAAAGVAPVSLAEPPRELVLPRLEVDAGAPVVTETIVDAGVTDAGAIDAGARSTPVDAGAAAATPVALEAPFDAGAMAPAPGKKQDPRFTVRWGRPGLCSEELDSRRTRVLAAMTPYPVGDVLVYHAGPVGSALLTEIGSSMIVARSNAAGLVDWSAAAPHPAVYLYDSLEDLRSVSCVNRQAIAYYDGAIHLAANESTDLAEVQATLRHEYMHHVLIQSGIQRPMWLHEGLAMYAAEETWWRDPRLGLQAWVQANHLPFPAMAYAFPHTADQLFALAAYYQSELMLLFIIHEHGPEHVRVVVRALSRGQISADEAFYWGVGLTQSGTEQAWARFVASQ